MVYLFTVFWYTVLKRSTGNHAAQFELFWSYRKWFAGDADLGNEIMANIAMFIPFGFLLSSVLRAFPQKHCRSRMSVLMIVLSSAALSLVIETLQLVTMRGLFEWDDVISNSLGGVLGWAMQAAVWHILPEKHASAVILSAGAVFVIVCAAVVIRGKGMIGQEADTTSRAFCFQIDSASAEGDSLQLSGFAFRYQHEPADFTLLLRPVKAGKTIRMETACYLPRPDVNSYFSSEKDYTDVGFLANADVPDRSAEYEVMIRWPWSLPVSTGVFVAGEDVRYFPKETFTAPNLDMSFVTEGIPRVFRPDFHCWVYQYAGELYWIAEDGFTFEDDGTTYIQYQMWTTQIENLPEKRLKRGNLWDNIGGHFEKYELEGFAPYRVMKRKIPTAYSVTSIVTGYYKSGEWVWKNYFRPYYELGINE